MQKHQFNLPLLFSCGLPTSLESMNLAQLQNFLLFLLTCERGKKVSSLGDLKRPDWWPEDVSFDDSLLEKQTKKGLWSSMLRKVISKCYNYHEAVYLLDFSRQLMQWSEKMAGKFVTVDNGDGTRSMQKISNKKVLVTFRKENQDYDSQIRPRATSLTCLSPTKKCLQNNTPDPTLPSCPDVYLCDICGADFDSLKRVLEHEKKCGVNQSDPNAKEIHSEVNSSQNYFEYLCLKSVQSTSDAAGSPELPSLPTSKSGNKKPISYDKFLSIDVSSPLGLYILKLSNASTGNSDEDRRVTCFRYSASSKRTSSRNLNFRVTFRGYRDKFSKQSPHLYCFNNEQLRVRLQTIRTGLSPRSLALFKSLSRRPCQIKLTRLRLKNPSCPSKEEISELLAEDKSSLKTETDSSENVIQAEETFTDPLMFDFTSEKKTVWSSFGISPENFYQSFMYKSSLPSRNSVEDESRGQVVDDVQIIDLCSSDDGMSVESFSDYEDSETLAAAFMDAATVL